MVHKKKFNSIRNVHRSMNNVHYLVTLIVPLEATPSEVWIEGHGLAWPLQLQTESCSYAYDWSQFLCLNST